MNKNRRRSGAWWWAAAGIGILGFASLAIGETTQSQALEGSAAPARKSDTPSTAPVFVPEEVQGVGDRWIVPEASQEELAVRESSEAASQSAAPASPVQEQPPSKTPSAAPTARPESASSALTRTPQRKESPRSGQLREERSRIPSSERDVAADREAEQKIPARPVRLVIAGRVAKVKALPGNELELQVDTRAYGRVKVIVSPLQVQRVPGPGRFVRLRGMQIRRTADGMTVRAMEILDSDEGTSVRPIVEQPVFVWGGFYYGRW